jgi:hypothetical protein
MLTRLTRSYLLRKIYVTKGHISRADDHREQASFKILPGFAGYSACGRLCHSYKGY